jgi:hypothetical protein
MKNKPKIIITISLLIFLFFTMLNFYTYYSNVKKIQELTKEKLRLEIEILKQIK